MSEYELKRLANDLIDKHYTCSMKIGRIMKHKDGRTIKIKSGYFKDTSNNRISNFWRWNEIFPDGHLGIEESGYGW